MLADILSASDMEKQQFLKQLNEHVSLADKMFISSGRLAAGVCLDKRCLHTPGRLDASRFVDCLTFDFI